MKKGWQKEEGLVMSEDRLQRIEDKVDQMAQAIVAMARMEERMITVFKRLDAFDAATKKSTSAWTKLKKQAIARGQKIAFAERLF